MTVARDPADIKAKFANMRTYCDPRGFHLLIELETLALALNSMVDLHEKIDQLQEQIMGRAPLGPLADVIPFPSPSHSVKVGGA